MANISALNQTAAGFDAVSDQLASGPRGKRPRRSFSGRNIIIYGTLFVAAVYTCCRYT